MKKNNFNNTQFREQIRIGLDMAFKKLLASKREADGYLILSENGRIKKIKATDIKDTLASNE